jgi:hypothetical protein
LLPFDAEWCDLVDEIDVSDEHAPAAIPLETQIVQYLTCVLALFHCVQILLVLVSNHLSTTPTSYWD